MVIRRATLADAMQFQAIWNQNAVVNRATWPDGPDAYPDWTFAVAQKALRAVINGNADCVVTVNGGGTVTTVLYVLKHRELRPPYVAAGTTVADCDEATVWLVRMNGLTVPQIRARFLGEMPALIEAWGRDAVLRAVPLCAGRYPAAGNATALAALDAMETRNGQSANIVGPWRYYAVTPTQLIIGAGGVP